MTPPAAAAAVPVEKPFPIGAAWLVEVDVGVDRPGSTCRPLASSVGIRRRLAARGSRCSSDFAIRISTSAGWTPCSSTSRPPPDQQRGHAYAVMRGRARGARRDAAAGARAAPVRAPPARADTTSRRASAPSKADAPGADWRSVRCRTSYSSSSAVAAGARHASGRRDDRTAELAGGLQGQAQSGPRAGRRRRARGDASAASRPSSSTSRSASRRP